VRIIANRIPFFLVCVIIVFLPFFEGGETPLGLFLIHTFTLSAFVLVAVTHSRIWIPRFLIYFVPFLAALLVSTAIAPYKYSAFLQLWDYFVAAIFSVTLFSVLKESENERGFFVMIAFLAGSTVLLASVLASPLLLHFRIRGSFVNPIDFASYALLLVLFGLFQFERESDPRMKRMIAFIIVLVSICIILSASRSVFLAGGIFIGLYLWRRKPGKVMFTVMTLTLLVGAGVLLYRFQQQDPFQYYRLRIWKHSLEGILQDPYLGVGLNMLPFHAARFNFPGDDLVGRYAFIAPTADNQYLQILAETGFLGLFTFLVGWLGIYFLLKRFSNHFFVPRCSVLVVSLISLFSLPLENTAILFLFLFLVILPPSLDTADKGSCLSFPAAGRIVLCVLSFLLFSVAVYLPYAAIREFKTALEANDLSAAQKHLSRALLYNPYQPYYRFAFVKRIVESNPPWKPSEWLTLIGPLNESIQLNPLERDFYAYRARIYAILTRLTRGKKYYSQAVSSFQSALDRAPYDVFLRIQLASFLGQWGRLDLAEKEVERAIESEPVYLDARFLMALIRQEKGDHSGARAAFVEAENYYNRYRNFPKLVEPEAGSGRIRAAAGAYRGALSVRAAQRLRNLRQKSYYKALLAIDPGRIEEIRKRIFSREP